MKFNFLAYRPVPVTLLISTIYIAIFFALYLTDSLPDVPQDTHGLDVERAYADLHNITTRPHPYHSHANDIVRKFLLSRLGEVTKGYEYAHVEEDNKARVFWKSEVQSVIFQASNILVKIDGYDERFSENGGVLFSAHYDSVSTAPGATDDGIAVVSLLQLVEHFVKNRPRRTAIFNINNGEEDGLNGAQAFVRHPWAKIPDTFINLEGAGAGGPPLLFRATSIEPVKAFARGLATNTTTYRVKRAHGNVLSSDVFSQGVIRSGTDFSVYAGDSALDHKLEGVDLAFYKPRSRYHTVYDSIPGAKGKAKQALWAMLENAWGAGGVLLNVESRPKTAKPAVYFDLFKSYFVVFELGSLQTFNLVLLFAGPAIVLFFYALLPFLYGHFNIVVEVDRPSLRSRILNVFRLNRRSEQRANERPATSILAFARKAWSWSNLWIPTAIFIPSIVLHVITIKALLSGNRLIGYSQQYTLMLLNLSVTLIVITFLLGSPAISTRLRGARIHSAYILPDRQAIFLHLYIFTYLLLILAAYAANIKIGGLYWITAWHAGVCAACIIGGVETFFARSQRVKELHMRRRFLLNRDARRASGDGNDSDSDADESVPLLPGSRTVPEIEAALGGKDSSGWWILQALLTVPIPVMLIGHVLLLLQDALGQTLSDGSSAAFVYAANAILCFFIVLPVTPFASGIHRYVTYFAAAICIYTLVSNLTTFPFSQETPLKVFFQQSVHLNSTNQAMPGGALGSEVIHVFTSLSGVQEYIKDQVVSQLPSSWSKDLDCTTNQAGGWTGLSTCSWNSGADMIPYPGGRSKDPWLQVDAVRLSPTEVRLDVEGKNTRACRIYFDEMQIMLVSLVEEGKKSSVALFPNPTHGVSSVLKYWSREWDQKFTVEVDLNELKKNVNGTGSEDDALRFLRGRVACEWAEYESGMVGLDVSEIKGPGYLNPKIPALEETFRFLPQWAVVSKATDGLVEAWTEFEV